HLRHRARRLHRAHPCARARRRAGLLRVARAPRLPDARARGRGMSAPLLVELFCEELPPRALERLGAAFAQGIADGLASRGLVDAKSSVRAFASPRRLAALIPDVREKGEDQPLEMKLMPLAVARTPEGKASEAL